jgi:hypothetical protein
MKNKTHLQVEVRNKNQDIYLYQGDTITIFERRHGEIPCADADIMGFYERFKDLQHCTLQQVMYDFDNGNIGVMKARYIYPFNLIDRSTILKIGADLTDYIEFNDMHWWIEWELISLKELAIKYENN